MQTITQASATLGMNPRTIRKLCLSLGLGVMVHPRLRVLSGGDLAILRKNKRKVGNPDFVRKRKVKRA